MNTSRDKKLKESKPINSNKKNADLASPETVISDECGHFLNFESYTPKLPANAEPMQVEFQLPHNSED